MAQRVERPDRGFLGELKGAVTPRAALLVIGVLLLQLGFITSYVGALHSPKPHELSVAVVAPPQVAPKLVGALEQVPNEAVKASTAPDAATATQRIKDQKLYAALVFNPTGTQDTLLVADARGPAAARAATTVVTALDQAQGRTVQVENVIPLAKGDANGLSSFYLVIGWCVGGYLVASILGISAGARPANGNRAVIRLGVLALYSVAAGIGGAVIVGPVLNALPGSLWGLYGLGALVVFSVGAITMAMQSLFDIIGIGLAVLVFVVLGNPSAGGVFPPPMMPTFWRAIGAWIPNGAGTDVARSIAYFGGTNIGMPLLVLFVWALIGILVTLVAVVRKPRLGRPALSGQD
ncbi:membrane protein [Kitasatospora sp. MMS16-BH015]|uniref:ABC transporter permease n=1 Tax=Kitasatospora sp. MMS16-BH015 TaxID=2018025 RepID=UPI000CA32E86|nr:ABC transporter permease [Kitasatospora sp. MMS16-BH015]AUG79649.1 membrane protein [Kitasatospora sp. MMS16-BH015]